MAPNPKRLGYADVTAAVYFYPGHSRLVAYRLLDRFIDDGEPLCAFESPRLLVGNNSGR
jgi:hypothetical protein